MGIKILGYARVDINRSSKFQTAQIVDKCERVAFIRYTAMLRNSEKHCEIALID